MIFSEGLTHPLDNPSLGPSAKILSSFGINNPSLVVHEFHLYRLISSNFLCSGILTYFITISALLRCVKDVEKLLGNSNHFMFAIMIIAFGSNLLYSCLGKSFHN